MNCSEIWILVFIVTCMCCYSNSYPNGPPTSVCGNGLPVHMKDGKVILPQKLPSPYTIEVNATTFVPGETIDVKIKSYFGQAFRGLFVQVVAIPKGPNDSIEYSPVGLYERNIRNIKLMTCRFMLDTLTHQHRFMKFETSFKWRSPLIMRHDVVVRATILKEFDLYWHNVESSVIKLKSSGVLPAETLEKPWLEEIIKTVKASDDVVTRRKLARERFNKGYQNALTPDGIVMVHYVTNILPFKDSPVPGYKATAHKPVDNSTETKEIINVIANISGDGTGKTEEKNTQTVLNNTNINNSTDITDPKVVHKILIEEKESLNEQTMQKFYDVLVEALLSDDKEVANTLHEIISEKTP